MPSFASRSSASTHAAWQPPTVTSPIVAPGVRVMIGAGTALAALWILRSMRSSTSWYSSASSV